MSEESEERTVEDVRAEMIRILTNQHDWGHEEPHLRADQLLVELARIEGHDDIADMWERVAPKHYA